MVGRAGIAIALVAAGTAGVLAQSAPEDARALAARAAERIRGLQREADQLAAQTRTLLSDLRKLEIDRAIALQRVTEADAALAAVTGERDEAAARVKRLEAARVASTPGLAERLESIYKRGRGGYARLLLSSDDPRAFGRLTRGVAAIATLDKVRVDTHRRTLELEREALETLENRHQQVAASQKAAADARLQMDKAAQARNTAIDQLDRRRDQAAQYVAELQQAQVQLTRTVDAMGETPTDLPFQPFRGALEWPVAGKVLSRFGASRDSRFGTAIVRNGIEIAAPEGTPVHAVHGGLVAYAAPFSGFGTLIIVDHGRGAFTMYGHLAEARVERGAKVSRQSVIGTVGLAPAGAAALYFEVRVDGRPADPLQWLRSSP
ncbi:MAG TPA: peptidoglycan DD-metalloendopeptidase family protein [Vicinamibacterales bacterium]|nr:peptidoglycan DD-metalloendopeptidase family protein [Vicinamibacterales bacterium]